MVMAAAVAAQAQTIGSRVSSDNITFGTEYSSGTRGYQVFSNDLSRSDVPQGAIAAPEYSPVLMNATSLGAGAVGSFPLHNNLFLRISILSLYSPVSSFNAVPYTQGILMPVQVGYRMPFLRSNLNTLGYTLYGEGSAGLLLGFAYPTGGSFLNYSLPYSRFTSGASAYLGIGNSIRVARFVGLYLNGGVGYYNFFSSSFMPQTRYVVPSVSVGFMFNFM